MEDILAIPEIETTLDPAIWVEPKDRGTASEDARQTEFVAFMRKHCRACRVVAIPNGGKRSLWAAAKAKREGMLAGEPDTVVTWADAPSARIEFKGARTMPSAEQIEALNWYFRRGHPVAVCRTMEGALRFLASVGAPVPGFVAPVSVAGLMREGQG